MKRLLTPLFLLVLLLAACGSDNTELTAGSPDDDSPIPVEPDGGIGDGAEPLPTDPDADPVEPVDPPKARNEQVIIDFDPVDPRVTTPDSVDLNPEDPTVLFVRFTGGDVNCTAASVTILTETPTEVAVELLVGITSDALVKSCLAGEFNLRVDVPLSEDATDKLITWNQSSNSDEPQQVTPDLTTDDFIGLTEAEAAAIADDNLLVWRVVRVDTESFALTEDFNPGRLNFEIDDGTITVVTLG